MASADFTLYLSSEGDTVEIKSGSATIPEQQKAASCKTHAEVLAFLEELKASPPRHLTFYHRHNNAYQAHFGGVKGVAHPCSLEKQIEFVKYKILEQKQKPVNPPKPPFWSNLLKSSGK